MNLSPKQAILIDHCRNNNGITTKQANELLKNFYYSNHEHYVSEVLSRLVKSGLFVRVSKGNYILGSRKSVVGEVAENQIKLL